MSTPLIVIATSAPRNRPEYRRDFLTCLGSPTGHRVSFSFRASWIQPHLLRPDVALENRRALIIFCDEPERPGEEFEFVALRHATTSALRPAELINRRLWTRDTHIAVDFNLGHFVHAADADLTRLKAGWNEWLGAAQERPRPQGHPDSDDARFVFELDGFREGQAVADDLSWRALSETLAECRSLDGAFFFRVDALRTLKEHGEGRLVLPESAGPFRLVYPLTTNAQYVLALDAYSMTGETPLTEALTTGSDSDKLTVSDPRTEALGRGTHATITVTTGPVQASEFAGLTIQGAPTYEHDVARIHLLTRVTPSKTAIIVAIILLALGAVISGVSTDDLGLPSAAVYPLKVLGGLMVGSAAFYALRRAPGVSS